MGNYELQLIDCNCNDCKFMVRDLEKYKYWLEKKKLDALFEFNQQQHKATVEAYAVINQGKDNNDMHLIKSGEGMLRVARKMNFQFNKEGLISYGNCTKFNKPVSFIPAICQLETQQCFKHRKH